MKDMEQKYFFTIKLSDREIVQKWLKKVEGVTKRQRDFLEIVEEAINTINYDYRIATIEPSSEFGEIIYEEGRKVEVLFSGHEWNLRSKEYAPEYGSRLATLYELFLWYAYRIAVGFWTIEYVCDDSSSEGNYWNSPQSFHGQEVSSARKVGGFCDGTGNLFKIVKDYKNNFSLCGGTNMLRGSDYPVADVLLDVRQNSCLYNATACIVLEK